MKADKLPGIDSILKRANSRYRTSLVAILSFFGLEKNDVELYKALAKKRLKIKELSAKLHLSERTVRRHIKFMLERGFIKRKAVEGKRLAYEYMPSSPTEIWKNIKTEIRRNVSFMDRALAAGIEETGRQEKRI